VAEASRAIGATGPAAWKRWTAIALSLFFLNACLTFENLWPTPAVTWLGEISIELACVLVLFGLTACRSGRVPPALVSVVSALWLALLLGRYADVTAPALYGRDINLYWDIRYVSDVAGMLTHSAPTGLVVLIGVAVLGLLAGVFLIIRMAFRIVAGAMVSVNTRRAVLAAAAIIVVLFAVQTSGTAPRILPFATPVSSTYAHQLLLVRNARAANGGARVLAPSPAMDENLATVRNTDVFLVFIESYGAVAYDRPEFNARLTASRTRLAEAIAETNRDAVSAFVESPTFGGSSWFAHISLLSGIEVRDPDTDVLLMTQQRDTLAKAFARSGHRTIGWMPGLKQPWPEGSFYGFDAIYGAKRVAYTGPEFGWFAVPDEFSFARLDQAEVAQENRKPLFVFFPTLSTHTPFSPTPPYQADWSKLLTPAPFDPDAVDHAYEEPIDYMNLSPYYGNAVEYAYTVLAGYLRAHAARDFVMILLGDHQPPALVSGEGAPWDVPVHVIASRGTDRERILERLRGKGFKTGLMPSRPVFGKMHELLPVLLDAMSEPTRRN
jgi:hypothetical protein